MKQKSFLALGVANPKHEWEFVLSKEGWRIRQTTSFSAKSIRLSRKASPIQQEDSAAFLSALRSAPTSRRFPLKAMSKEKSHRYSAPKKKLDSLDEKLVFLDGNKRTAVIFANHFLIRRGLGLLVIPAERVEEYKKLLAAFYETDDKKDIRFPQREVHDGPLGQQPDCDCNPGFSWHRQ